MRKAGFIAGTGLVLAAVVSAAPGNVLASPTVSSAQTETSSQLPAIGHVFVIMLENKSIVETFGREGATEAADDYLHTTAPAMGALLKEYYGTSHFSHSNYVTLTSGQPPNAFNQTDCMYYQDFESTGIDAQGINQGIGCVFPTQTKTIGDQLSASGKTWKAYAESMDGYDGPGFTAGPGCRRPKTNGYDATYSDEYNYAARHVPFLYFKSIADSPKCKDVVVDHSKFAGDLAKVSTTPNFSFIVPNTCNDGHQAKCVDGSPGGVPAINTYLETAVPQIMDSPAFKQDGLLLILFDEAEFDGDYEAANGCCEAPLGPNTGTLGGVVPGSGGGRTGAIAISPFIKPGTVSETQYNHYSTLRTIEDVFAQSHLGYADNDSVRTFGSDVFTG